MNSSSVTTYEPCTLRCYATQVLCPDKLATQVPSEVPAHCYCTVLSLLLLPPLPSLLLLLLLLLMPLLLPLHIHIHKHIHVCTDIALEI